nr:hypothetical protein [Tanacetum cinerariifolium]
MEAGDKDRSPMLAPGKEIANTPPTYDSELEVVSDEEATPRDKEIEKLMALISMSDRRTGYDRQTRQCENQMAVNVVEAKESVRTHVVSRLRFIALTTNNL